MDQNQEMRYKRQEMFDISQKELKPFHANGKDYQVYGNANLSIFVGKRCNATCNFCVAELRYFHEGMDYLKPAITDTTDYFKRLHLAMETVRPLNPSVSLTGGEPTIDPRLPEILRILTEYKVRKRTITTNGSGLMLKVAGSTDTILDRLIDYKLAHLNISRAHYDEEKNQRIMNLRDPSFSNKQLQEVIAIAKSQGIRPRLSCVLLKGEVDSLEEMKKYMDWAESIGVDNVVFRQLMKFDEARVKQGRIPSFCSEHGISLIPLWEEIDQDPGFSFINQVLGYYYYVEVFRYKGVDMVSEMADLRQIDAEKDRARRTLGEIPIIYELVFHPNGNLCGSWREWKEVILG